MFLQHGCEQTRVQMSVPRVRPDTGLNEMCDTSLASDTGCVQTRGIPSAELNHGAFWTFSSRQVTSSISCAEFCPRGAHFFATTVSGPSNRSVRDCAGFCVFSLRLTEGLQVDGYPTTIRLRLLAFSRALCVFRQDEFSVFHHIFGTDFLVAPQFVVFVSFSVS